MNVFFRVDGNSKIGWGHLKRCLTLANEFKKKNSECFFLSHGLAETFIEELKSNSFKYISLPAFKSEIDDATNVLEVLNNINLPLSNIKLVLDHYQLNTEWEKLISPHFPLITISDKPERTYFANYILNPGPAWKSADYGNFFHKKETKCFSGIDYLLVDETYRNKIISAKEKKLTNSKLENILISFGAADKHNMTSMVIHAAEEIFPLCKLHIVSPKSAQHHDLIVATWSKRSQIVIYDSLQDLSELSLNCDLAAGAGGVSMLERCTLGMPSIIIQTAENQNQNIKFLQQLDCISYIGTAKEVTAESIQNEMRSFLSEAKRHQMSQNAFKLFSKNKLSEMILEISKD